MGITMMSAGGLMSLFDKRYRFSRARKVSLEGSLPDTAQTSSGSAQAPLGQATT